MLDEHAMVKAEWDDLTFSQDILALVKVVAVVADGLEHLPERVPAVDINRRSGMREWVETYRKVVAPVKTSLFISRLRKNDKLGCSL